jgi:choline dehydrogenase-like flavoprotein
VPALALDNGQVLTEVAVILQYVADSRPESGLATPSRDLAHYCLLAWPNCSSTEILQAAGTAKPFEEFGTYDSFNATHVFGTCRMGADPRNSVVDKDCRSHRWRNLFVVDASVFPSSGGGESPSLTIEALAIRAGAHIRDLLAAHDL